MSYYDTGYETYGLFKWSKRRFTVKVDRRLDAMPYAQAGIRDLYFDDGPFTVLRSFDVDAAWIAGDGALTVTFAYCQSAVVRRHVIAFILQICAERELSLPDVKEIGRIAGRDRVLYLKSGLIRDYYNGFLGNERGIHHV